MADLEELTMKLRDERPALKAQGIELVAWGLDAESNTVRASPLHPPPRHA